MNGVIVFYFVMASWITAIFWMGLTAGIFLMSWIQSKEARRGTRQS